MVQKLVDGDYNAYPEKYEAAAGTYLSLSVEQREIARNDPPTQILYLKRFSVICLCHHLHPITKVTFAGEGGGGIGF